MQASWWHSSALALVGGTSELKERNVSVHSAFVTRDRWCLTAHMDVHMCMRYGGVTLKAGYR